MENFEFIVFDKKNKCFLKKIKWNFNSEAILFILNGVLKLVPSENYEILLYILDDKNGNKIFEKSVCEINHCLLGKITTQIIFNKKNLNFLFIPIGSNKNRYVGDFFTYQDIVPVREYSIIEKFQGNFDDRQKDIKLICKHIDLYTEK